MSYIFLNCSYVVFDINLTELDYHKVDYDYKVISKNLNSQNFFIQHCSNNYYFNNYYLDNTEYEEEKEPIQNNHSLYDCSLTHYNKPFTFYKTFSLNIFKRLYYFSDSILILHQVFMI